jgi:hypothetical protein
MVVADCASSVAYRITDQRLMRQRILMLFVLCRCWREFWQALVAGGGSLWHHATAHDVLPAV